MTPSFLFAWNMLGYNDDLALKEIPAWRWFSGVNFEKAKIMFLFTLFYSEIIWGFYIKWNLSSSEVYYFLSSARYCQKNDYDPLRVSLSISDFFDETTSLREVNFVNCFKMRWFIWYMCLDSIWIISLSLDGISSIKLF